jgi:phage gp36-like protein
MVAYSAPVDVRNVLAPGAFGVNDNPSLTHTAADLSDSQLEVEIGQADRIIDGYLNGYYATPVAVTSDALIPEPIHTWSANIAAYLATLTYRRGKDLSQQDPVYLRYQLTMQQLMATNSGRMTLNIPTQTSVGAVSGVGQAVNPYSGNLVGAEDFDLRPVNSAWPYYPDVPAGFPGRWAP